jgi:site-specific DNA recombinase
MNNEMTGDNGGERVRAAGYIRVSQERNARLGYGLGAQEIEVKRYIEYKQWDLVEVYREEGVSGYDKDRPALHRLLNDATAGRFGVVVFPSIDRAARSVRDVIDIDAALRKAKVDLIFIREGIDTSTPTGELYRNIIAAVAQWEGRIIYERMSKGKRRKASEGGYIGGWLPYGYRAEGGRVTVVPEEAKIVEWVFQRRAAGAPYYMIVNQLIEKRASTANGGEWGVSTLRGMLRNRFYTGRVEFDGQYIRAQHDAIVSDVLYERANAQ